MQILENGFDESQNRDFWLHGLFAALWFIFPAIVTLNVTTYTASPDPFR